jgi:hydrogenase/urease accessory protein HupE
MKAVTVIIALALLGGIVPRLASAHEIRPAYLEINEIAANRYMATWRTPLLSGSRLPVALSLPEGSKNATEPIVVTRSDSVIERRQVIIPGGIEGKRITLIGLEGTITDALVRLSFLDGRQTTEIVRPSQPYLDVASSRGWIEVASVYLLQGMRHILEGFDHLLFVFGLMLLVKSGWMLVKTITAFTVAHSLTLAVATYGFLHVPAAPLEAAIAASILFLGVEVVRAQQGRVGLAARWPWAIAFAFGLLHGVGFAIGLSMLGLPSSAIPMALVSFNLGVEVGQLLFVAVILLSAFALRQLHLGWPRVVLRAPVYVVGCLGAYWMIERASSIFAS